jgi:hypothetical protein
MYEKNTIATAIVTGELDDILDHLDLSITMRRETLSDNIVNEISIGDDVRFNDSVKPKYLAGKTAKVVKINRKTIVVDCPDDPEYRRFANSKRVRCPNSIIEKV